ncbi:MAG: hypothetical protein L0211_26580 [Planctomycetaceae bacterium]|nr:hypothetical protein [Planctomycetaceae bacterium]
MHCCRCFALQLVAVSLAAFALGGAEGQEFRIDTEIFIGEEKEPAAETLTIFSQGLVYDFLLSGQEEITMLDTVRGRFTLIDPARKVKCGLAVQEVLEQTLSLEAHAAESKDALFMFAAAPQFETKVEETMENGQPIVRLNLTARTMEYAVVARPTDRPEATHAFRYFADQFARLNALRPGNLPPGARLALNKALAERKLLPLEITRTIPPATPLGRKLVVRSRHLVNWSLSGEDRKKIDRAGTHLAKFESVSFEEYRTQSAKPAVKTAGK